MSFTRRTNAVEKMIPRKTTPPVKEPKATATATKTSWPIPSLRLVIVCVSLAVALTMSALIIFVDVSAPSLADIFLSSIYFPLGQGLQLRTRRVSSNRTECIHFYKPAKDENFWRLGGMQCGQAVWQSTANVEEKDRYVRKISTHYKLFQNDAMAVQYFHGYWSEKSKELLPTPFYSNETENAPTAGDDFQALRWDPQLNDPPAESSRTSSWPRRAASTARHIIYIFRKGRIFARLLVQGFNNSKDSRLGVEFAGRLAGMMAQRIEQNEPTPARKFLLNIQWGIRHFIRATPLLCAQKPLSVLSHWTTKLLNCTWSSLRVSIISQLFSFWKSLTGSGLRDLLFAAVAVLLLILHKLHTALMPYDQMDFTQVKCQSMLTTAIERARRQNLLNQDLFLQTN